MEQIDVYDFDKTLVPFDSGSRFIAYCVCHYPWIIIFLPLQLIGLILGGMGIISFTQYKKFCFCFVAFIPLGKAVCGFWNKHEKDINPWFYDRKRKAVVISASPDFLLKEIQKRLGFEVLICTRHNAKTGAIIGENCRGEEKVKRLWEIFDKDKVEIIDVCSDSYKHDKPIFSLGKNCYHIENKERKLFDYKEFYNE